MITGERHWRLVRAGRDAVPASIRSATARIPSGRRYRRRRLIRLVGLLAAVGVSLTSLWVFYGTTVFGVSRVRVTGTKVLTVDEVRAAAGVSPGTPLAGLDVDTVTGRVSRLAPVARVVVWRDWPDTVRIQVTERTAVAVVPATSGYQVLDGAGVVFDRVAERPARLPLVDLADPGPGDTTTHDALGVLRALSPPLRQVLVKLSAPSPTRIRLHLTGGRTVLWGDAEDSGLKSRVATVLLRHRVRVIDVSAPEVVTTR